MIKHKFYSDAPASVTNFRPAAVGIVVQVLGMYMVIGCWDPSKWHMCNMRSGTPTFLPSCFLAYLLTHSITSFVACVTSTHTCLLAATGGPERSSERESERWIERINKRKREHYGEMERKT